MLSNGFIYYYVVKNLFVNFLFFIFVVLRKRFEKCVYKGIVYSSLDCLMNFGFKV